MTKTDKIYKIAINYGYEAQSRQCIEEMAELTQAINKFWRKMRGADASEAEKARDHVIEELSDVQIMVWQMIQLLGAEREVDTEIEKKLDRQIARIKNE